MGHSQAAKAESHRKIVQRAARDIRERGIEALSVAELMKSAGLTHGGFYGHFASRDALIEEALEAALTSSARNSARIAVQGVPREEPSLRAWARGYLSRDHRDHPGTGCAMASLAGDMRGAEKPVRARFTRALRGFHEAMARFLGPGPAARREAINAVSLAIGALVLARAVEDEALSDEIVLAARQAVSALGNS